MSSESEVKVSLHAHPVRPISRDGWSCDGHAHKGGCESRSSKPSGTPRYQCAQGCNFDLCQQCVDASETPAVAEVSIHPHPLSILDRSGWTCDGAREPGGCQHSGTPDAGAVRYHCSQNCNWDCCDKCVRSFRQGPSSSPPSAGASGDLPEKFAVSNHPHELSVLAKDGWSCDGARSVAGGCGGVKAPGSKRYHCSASCDYDLCEKCARIVASLPSPATAGVVASSSSCPSSKEPSGPPPDYDVGRARLREAKGIFYREELYRKAMEGAQAQAARGAEHGCAELEAFMEELRAVERGYERYVLDKKVEEATDWVARKLSYAKSQPLSWKERVYEAYAEVRTRIAELRADAALKGQQQVQECCAAAEATMAAHEDDIMSQVAADKLGDDKGFVTRQLKYA